MLWGDVLVCHLVGDFILQTDFIAARKLRDWRIRLLHVALYLLPFLWIVFSYSSSVIRGVIFLVAVGVTHFILDSGRIASGENWPPKPIVVDQVWHLVTLAFLIRIL